MLTKDYTEQELISFQFYQYIEKQKAYMLITGQLDEDGNKTNTCPNYTELFDEEEGEFVKAEKSIDKLDALADMIVCLCGQVATKEIPYVKGLALFEVISIHGSGITTRFFEAVDEVFDNNKRRLTFDENGKVKLQSEFLDNGKRNPKAFKTVKNNSEPNLEQFLINNL